MEGLVGDDSHQDEVMVKASSSQPERGPDSERGLASHKQEITSLNYLGGPSQVRTPSPFKWEPGGPVRHPVGFQRNWTRTSEHLEVLTKQTTELQLEVSPPPAASKVAPPEPQGTGRPEQRTGRRRVLVCSYLPWLERMGWGREAELGAEAGGELLGLTEGAAERRESSVT